MPHIYIVQPADLIGTNRFKVGMTTRPGLERLKSYGAQARCLRYFECEQYREAEAELINALNQDNRFRLIRGKEYFEGPLKELSDIFHKVINKYEFIEENGDNPEVDPQIQIYKANRTNPFDCKICNVKCKCAYDLKRHLDTKKHKANADRDNYCRACYKTLSNKFNKERHEKSCNVFQTIIKDIETKNKDTRSIMKG